MSLMLAVVTDVVAITILVFGIYYRRHVRRDLVLAYIALNVGVMAVTATLAGSGAGIGLGLGLFGILSIIRLRSDQITQAEIAYYFTALAMGLVAGLNPSPAWLTPLVAAGLLTVMYAADHPRFAARTHRQTITLDRAYPHQDQLRSALQGLLGGEVLRTEVDQLDMVRDMTIVDVRYRLPGPANNSDAVTNAYREGAFR